MTDVTPPLVLQNATKRFGSKLAAEDVSFTVEPGQIIGFLGPNGAGKTTSLRMALGLIKPDTGSVDLFGQAPGAHAFGRVGFLPEERGLYRKLSAREAVAHIARLSGMKGRAAFKRADEMLKRYGLGDVRKKKIKTLSKGMAQKVQLIAAIAHDPEFLILDEPFSGLDPVNQQVLEDMVREIAQKGRTILFSTHVMEHAERLCDRIILMSGGQKVFDGSTEEALSYAPLRLVIESPDPKAHAVLEPMSREFKVVSDGVYQLELKEGVTAQIVLEAFMSKKMTLIRFEPARATLHEAFVKLVENSTHVPELKPTVSPSNVKEVSS